MLDVEFRFVGMSGRRVGGTQNAKSMERVKWPSDITCHPLTPLSLLSLSGSLLQQGNLLYFRIHLRRYSPALFFVRREPAGCRKIQKAFMERFHSSDSQ